MSVHHIEREGEGEREIGREGIYKGRERETGGEGERERERKRDREREGERESAVSVHNIDIRHSTSRQKIKEWKENLLAAVKKVWLYCHKKIGPG